MVEDINNSLLFNSISPISVVNNGTYKLYGTLRRTRLGDDETASFEKRVGNPVLLDVSNPLWEYVKDGRTPGVAYP